MSKFTVSKASFLEHFIEPLSKFDLVEKTALVTLKNKELIGTTYMVDRSVMLDVRLKDITGADFDPVVFKDLLRIKNGMSYVDNKNPEFSVSKTCLEYVDDSVKLTSQFMDNRFFDPRHIEKLKKIKELEFDFSFGLTQEALSKINKSKQVAATINKIYFDADVKTGVSVVRKDDEKPAMDLIGFKIADSFEGKAITNFPLHISTFNLISEKSETMLFSVNTKFGIVSISVDTPTYNLNYITSALRK